jgi:hypothetical protein
MMKRNIILAALGGLVLSGCGYSACDNDMIGQVKKVVHNTPLICPDYNGADISLGVMRNGVGSMSTEDVWVTVPDRYLFDALKNASASGAVVKITFDVKRLTICIDDHIVTGVEVLK